MGGFKISSAYDVVTLLGHTVDELLALDNSVARNRALAAVGDKLLKAFEQTEIEGRLRALEFLPPLRNLSPTHQLDTEVNVGASLQTRIDALERARFAELREDIELFSECIDRALHRTLQPEDSHRARAAVHEEISGSYSEGPGS